LFIVYCLFHFISLLLPHVVIKIINTIDLNSSLYNCQTSASDNYVTPPSSSFYDAHYTAEN